MFASSNVVCLLMVDYNSNELSPTVIVSTVVLQYCRNLPVLTVPSDYVMCVVLFAGCQAV